VTQETIYGVLSLIAWALFIVVTVKYVLVMMRADNHGEGGILALTTLALRATKPGSRAHRWVLAAGLMGAALFYGDGLITPAISVLSAVEGLKVATPLFEPYIIPITIALLIGLFMMQRHGTAHVGRLSGRSWRCGSPCWRCSARSRSRSSPRSCARSIRRTASPC